MMLPSGREQCAHICTWHGRPLQCGAIATRGGSFCWMHDHNQWARGANGRRVRIAGARGAPGSSAR